MFLAIKAVWLQRCARRSRLSLLNHHRSKYALWLKDHGLEFLAVVVQQQRGLGVRIFSPDCPYGHDSEVQILCGKGQLDKALEALFRMDEQGAIPRVETYRFLLKACTKRRALAEAKQVYAHVVTQGLESAQFLGDSAVNTLVQCGSLKDALQVFSNLPNRTVLSWTAVISGYIKAGRFLEAVRMYECMRNDGVIPNKYTFINLLKACGSMADLEKGKRIHSEVVKYSCESDVFVVTCLVDMYAKCGNIVDAQFAFDGLRLRDVVSWTTMLGAYVQQGKVERALEMFVQMQEEGVSPDAWTFTAALQACSSLAKQEDEVQVHGQLVRVDCLTHGKVIHAEARRRGCDSHVFVGNALISMYGRCGSLLDAQAVFDVLLVRNDVSWNAMLAACIQKGQPEKAMELYGCMPEEGFRPDALAIVSVLQACASLAEKENPVDLGGQMVRVNSLLAGKGVHAEARREYKGDMFVSSTLVSMYAKCGSILDAQTVFDGLWELDMVSWNAMLASYAQQGYGGKTLQLYHQLLEEAFCPDDWTLVSAAQACGSLAEKETIVVVGGHSLRLDSLRLGKEIHAEARRRGHESSLFLGNALVTMYGKCGSIMDSKYVFEGLLQRDIVSWNAMLAAYAQQDQGALGLQLYGRMQEEGVSPNETTFVCILHACGNAGSLDNCSQIHYHLVSSGNHLSYLVARTLIHAYGKCGQMASAKEVFDALPQPDVSSWNALIAGYSRQGQCEEAFQCYEGMLVAGVTPNAITFSSLLSACSHAGLVDQGVDYFDSMSRDHGITPEIQHYGSMVDLLGRAGCFNLVEDLLLKMPTQGDLSMYLCVLHACRKHGNVILGKRAFDYAIRLQPGYGASYVLMSHIYEHAGMWLLSQSVEQLRQKAGAWKNPGQSWIELEQGLETFGVGKYKNQHAEYWSQMLDVRLTQFVNGK